MKRQVHARKRRQLKSLAKQLHQLSKAGLQKEKFLALRVKINTLLQELRAFFSTRSLIRMLGKSALLLGVGLSTSGLLAQEFAEPAWSPFGLEGAEFGLLSSAAVSDLDDDGDIDILICAFLGNQSIFQYFENIGTANMPQYEEAISSPFGLVTSGLEVVDINPTIGDLDGDGDQDILTIDRYDYEDGKVNFYENIGSSSEPFFTNAIVNPFGLEQILTAI